VEVELEKEGVGYYDKISGLGANEVIIETPDHDQVYSQLPVDNLTEIFLAYRERIKDLKKDKRLKYVLIFKNYGESAGAVLDHPHSQLIAVPILPKQIAEELRGAKDYFTYRERCIFCDIVHQELDDRDRLVFENKDFLVISPWAPIFPFELWVLPRGHRPCFEDSPDNLLRSLAESVKTAMVKLDIVLERPHFNLILHTVPFDAKESEDYHWHFEIMPRLIQIAGFEYGSGFYINPVPPEQAADFLRRAEL
jgi:UDPglucose--hexose-1-phosphate uridylyltransferase